MPSPVDCLRLLHHRMSVVQIWLPICMELGHCEHRQGLFSFAMTFWVCFVQTWILSRITFRYLASGTQNDKTAVLINFSKYDCGSLKCLCQHINGNKRNGKVAWFAVKYNVLGNKTYSVRYFPKSGRWEASQPYGNKWLAWCEYRQPSSGYEDRFATLQILLHESE
jgi:hypothetical protein